MLEERTGVEVHVLPFEVGELSPSDPRVQGDDNEGMKVVWQRGEQSAGPASAALSFGRAAGGGAIGDRRHKRSWAEAHPAA